MTRCSMWTMKAVAPTSFLSQHRYGSPHEPTSMISLSTPNYIALLHLAHEFPVASTLACFGRFSVESKSQFLYRARIAISRGSWLTFPMEPKVQFLEWMASHTGLEPPFPSNQNLDSLLKQVCKLSVNLIYFPRWTSSAFPYQIQLLGQNSIMTPPH